jgi:hypothetical protein
MRRSDYNLHDVSFGKAKVNGRATITEEVRAQLRSNTRIIESTRRQLNLKSDADLESTLKSQDKSFKEMIREIGI